MNTTSSLPKSRQQNKRPGPKSDANDVSPEVAEQANGGLAEGFAPHTLVPVSVVRSALFGVGATGKECKDLTIAVDKRLGAEVRYSGPYLNQHHFKVWQACVYLAKGAGGLNGQPFVVSNFADLLRLCGRDPGESRRYAQTWRLLRDLQRANIEIETGRVSYVGSLILEANRDKESGKLVINLSANLAQFMSNETLSNDMLRLAGLGKDQLAAWLHNYYASQKDPPPLTVAEIKKLSGTKLDMPRLRQRLKRALARLQGGIRPLVIEWRIDSETDLVYVTKNPTTVDMRTTDAIAQAAIAKRKAVNKGGSKGGGIFGAGGPKQAADGSLLPAM